MSCIKTCIHTYRELRDASTRYKDVLGEKDDMAKKMLASVQRISELERLLQEAEASLNEHKRTIENQAREIKTLEESHREALDVRGSSIAEVREQLRDCKARYLALQETLRQQGMCFCVCLCMCVCERERERERENLRDCKTR